MKNQKSTPFNNFISFRKFISLTFIQIIYVIGAVAIVIVSLGIILGFDGSAMASSNRSVSAANVLSGLGLLVFGSLLWRVLCEAWILFFRLADSVSNIEAKVNQFAGMTGSPSHSQETHQPGGGPWVCPKCQANNLGNTYKCHSCGYSLV